jgi:hypothetical protein
MALQKQDGGLRPILWGDLASLLHQSRRKCNSIPQSGGQVFTSTYDNFIQTAGIRDGASHCDTILSVFLIILIPPDINNH